MQIFMLCIFFLCLLLPSRHIREIETRHMLILIFSIDICMMFFHKKVLNHRTVKVKQKVYVTVQNEKACSLLSSPSKSKTWS